MRIIHLFLGVSYLCLATMPMAQTQMTDEIKSVVAKSSCTSYDWNNRGVAARGYVQGVAYTYARALCNQGLPEVMVLTKRPDMAVNANDGLLAYRSKFAFIGINESPDGVDSLRNTYGMLIGLGVRESSGKYCEGRDVSQCFVKAENAEAGLIQTSFGASRKSPVLPELFKTYASGARSCMVEDYGGPKSCKIRSSNNPACPTANSDTAGIGPGADWQQLTKSCPAFAVEYGAVVIRVNGGSGQGGTPKGEFGPIRTGSVELHPPCFDLLREVEKIVERYPGQCKKL